MCRAVHDVNTTCALDGRDRRRNILPCIKTTRFRRQRARAFRTGNRNVETDADDGEPRDGRREVPFFSFSKGLKLSAFCHYFVKRSPNSLALGGPCTLFFPASLSSGAVRSKISTRSLMSFFSFAFQPTHTRDIYVYTRHGVCSVRSNVRASDRSPCTQPRSRRRRTISKRSLQIVHIF